MDYSQTYSKHIKYWSIDRSYLFLNHGSFGACPPKVLEKQKEYQRKLEQQPMKFMTRDLPELLKLSKSKLSDFVGAEDQNLVFIRNATTGVNTVLRSLPFQKGDEIIITNHIYPACRNAVNFIAKERKILIQEGKIPFPIDNENIVIEKLLEAVSPRTKLLLIDHISSPTGLLFPIEQIIKEFRNMGIEVLVDGAHAPGSVELNLEQLGAAYYTGNCHKWICSPKGSAFLYVRPDKQEQIHPLVISLTEGKDKSFEERFYWTGTEDPSAYLCVGDAIDFMGGLMKNGWKEIIQNNHDLALNARKLMADSFKTPPPCPDSMIANLASLPIPDTKDNAPVRFNQFDSLQNELFGKYKVEVFVTYWPEYPKRLVRISPQLYNSIKQYNLLGDLIREILSEANP